MDRDTGRAANIGRHTAMFSDVAVTPGCVSCHNEHPNSPKRDRLQAQRHVVGTTWSYPKDEVTLEEVVQIVAALRSSFAAAYDGCLAKTATFDKPPDTVERLLRAFDGPVPTN